MAKGLPYFKFVPTEWLTGNISYEAFELQGLFINICALYWQRDGVLEISEVEFRYKKKHLIAKLTDRFFIITDGFISIEFLDEQFTERQYVKNINSENGKLGGRPPLKEKKPKKSQEEGEEEVEKNKNKKKKENKNNGDHLFSLSPFFEFEVFEKEFLGTEYEIFDLKIYYEKVKNWSASKGSKRKDWIATARNFMIGDREKGKQILKNGAIQVGKPSKSEALLEQDKNLREKYG